MFFSTKPRHIYSLFHFLHLSILETVPQTGLEPAHSDFKPDTTANYVTGAFILVPPPRFELGHYASKAYTTANYVMEADITEESPERGFYWWNRTTEVLIRSQLFIH